MEHEQRFSWLHSFLLASVNIWGGSIFGYNTGIVALAGDPITKEYDLTSFTKGILAASILIGATVGSIAGGLLCDLIGRKKALFAATILAVAGAVSSAFSPSGVSLFFVLVLLRIVLGVGVGLVAVACPLYVSEMCPSAKRGVFGCLFQLAITLAILVSYVVGEGLSYLPNPYDWRTMLGLGAVPGVVLFLFTPFVAESTVWLAAKAKKEDEEARTAERLMPSSPEEVPQGRGGWVGLVSPRNFKPLALGVVLAVSLQLTVKVLF